MIRPSSFRQGKDHEVLSDLIDLHAPHRNLCPDRLRILDVTYGKGTMWRHTGLAPYRMDLDPEKGLDWVGSFMDKLPWANGNEYQKLWDVVVFDPPHISDVGSTSAFMDRYIGPDGPKGKSIAPYFAPFLEQVKRVLAPDGIVLAKISDQVHGQAHQWQQVEFVQAVWSAGLVACDQVVNAHPSAGGIRGLWRQVLHTRNSHCFWIVVRQGPKCQRSTTG